MVLKTRFLLLFVAFFALNAQSQSKKETATANKSSDRPRSYLSLTSGLNNTAGLAGLTLEVPLSHQASGKISAGVGLWGVKLGLMGKYYADYPRSWSFGAGFSTASGLGTIDANVDATANQAIKTRVTLPRTINLDLVAGKGWGNKVRFNLELGWSVRVAGGNVSVASGFPDLEPNTKKAYNILRPGGLIVGLGLAFRL